jgi:hypothetical protein
MVKRIKGSEITTTIPIFSPFSSILKAPVQVFSRVFDCGREREGFVVCSWGRDWRRSK